MPIFWNSVNMDPKRQFRFYLRFPTLGQGLRIPQYVIKTVTKPKVTITSVPHTYLDHQFNYPGRVNWDPVTLTLVDPGTNEEDMATTLMNKLGFSGYAFPTNPDDFSSMSKAKASTAVGRVSIVQVDANGDDTEVWTLVNPFLTNIDFGSLDYSSDELSEVSIELTYDWAVLNGESATGPARKTGKIPAYLAE